MKHRKFNELYARVHGYFWLPCPLCGQHFGGHEWLPGTWEKPSHIPNDHSGGTGICPDCTKAGKGINYPPRPFYVNLGDETVTYGIHDLLTWEAEGGSIESEVEEDDWPVTEIGTGSSWPTREN